MYKVLLVDDELLTRETISKNVPWAEVGFQLVGMVENGREAISLVEKEPPDLVLTDICMPVMDGLALSGYLHENYPEIKVIIISGYEDFEYAKQAIRYEVSNYILKPITSYELTEELQKVKEKIEDSREKKREFETAQKKYKENIPTLRSHFLNRLVEGSYVKNDVRTQMDQLGIRADHKWQSVVMLEVEDAAAYLERYPLISEELIEFSVANIAEEVVRDHPGIMFFLDDQKKTRLIFGAAEEEALYELIEATGQTIVDAIRDYLDTKICVLIGKAVSDVKGWSDSFQSVLDAKEYHFLFEGKVFIYGKDVHYQKSNDQMEFLYRVDHLVLMIKLNQINEIEDEVAHIFECLRLSGKEKKQILVAVQNLVLLILIALEDHAGDKVKEYNQDEFVLQLTESRHLSEIEERFLNFCVNLSNNVAGKRENLNQKQAILAMDYIEKNYMNVDMSLHMVCEYLCVSTSYFSAIFKNATGETFIEALTRIRMDKAKDLLESSDLKNYEVALEVGYQDPHYFSSIFKKRLGVTPTEYVKQLRRGKPNE